MFHQVVPPHHIGRLTRVEIAGVDLADRQLLRLGITGSNGRMRRGVYAATRLASSQMRFGQHHVDTLVAVHQLRDT
jgi:hypothetical protein